MAKYTKLKNGKWKAEESFGYLSNGQQNKIRKQGFRTQKEAVEWVREQTEQQRKGFIQTNANKIIFKEYILDWYNNFKSVSLAQTTATNYVSRINNHIIPELGDYKIGEINNSVIQNFYNTLIKNGQLPATAEKIMQILSGVFRYAVKNKVIFNSPLDIAKQPKKKSKKTAWSKEEIDYFLKNVEDEYLYLPVFVAVLTGLRPGELCGLDWDSIDLKNKTINVNKQELVVKTTGVVYITDVLKTPTSYRTITISNILCDYLKKIKEERNAEETDYVILELSNPNPKLPCKSGNLGENFRGKIETLNKKNEFKLEKISLNGLRHTHTTLLVQNNINIKVIANRLGHDSITTTLEYYTHITPVMEKQPAMLLDKIF